MYETLVNTSTDCILVVDKNGLITFATPQIKKLFGWESEEIIGRPIEILIPESLTEKHIAHRQSYKKNPHPRLIGTSLNLYAKRKNKTEFPVDIALNFFKENGKTFYMAVIRDITERKLLETQITGFANILESSLNEIYTFDAATMLFINVNKGARKNLGYSSDEIKGLTPLDIKPEFTIKTFEELIKPLRTRKKEIIIFETVHQRKDGSRYPVEVHLQLTTLSEKDVFVSIVIDITDRKQAEIEIKSLAKFVSENPNSVLRIDLNAVLLYANETAIAMFPDWKLKVGQAVPEVLQKLTQKAEMQRVRKENIIYRDRIISATTMFLPDTGYVNIYADDITERIQAEKALRESEQKYRSLFENNITGVYTTTVEGKILDCNNAFVKMSGYSDKDEVLKANPENFYKHKQAREYFLKELKEKGYLLNNEIQLKKKDGSLIWILENVNLIEDNIIQGTIMDISERKEAEKKILQLSRGLEQSPAMVTITDTDGIIEYVNPKVTEIMGYAAEELLDKNMNVLSSGQTPKEIYGELWETILQGKVWKGEILNKRKNGELYWDSETIAPIIDNEGNIINFLSIREDITEKKKMVSELIEAKEKAEESNRVKSNFLANMSHELRTPMVGIIGFTEILEGEIENPELKEYATFIHEGANRLMESLNLILNLTKIEAEKINIDLSLIDVIKNIKKDVSTFDKIADKKNIYLKFESGIEQFETETDERMFDQIICNLVNNAVKFTEAGGVTVSVDKVKNNSYLKIKVKDTGIGIPKDKQEIIWEEFRQVSEGTSRKYEGTGLGLTITNNFVNQLGGEIKLKSELGEGSTFIVLLPIREKSTSTKTKGSPIDKTADRPETKDTQEELKHLLFVDDDKISREVVKRFLRGAYKLDLAFNGKEGIEKAKKKKYDGILMDINLKSKMDGTQATEMIREMKEYKDVPLIAVTAYAMVGDREKYLQAGFTDYISKPFLKNDLIELLNKAIKEKI